jgi:hypothetical protein
MNHKFITYREYSDVRNWIEKWFNTELRLRDKAVEIAYTENRRNMEHLNELRQGVITRPQFEQIMVVVNKRLTDLEIGKNRIFGAILLLSIIGIANLVKLFWIG